MHIRVFPLFLPLALAGCTLSRQPTTMASVHRAAAPTTWSDLLQGAPVIDHQAFVSARWSVPLSGLLDMDDPKAAGFVDIDTPIVLPVHVLRHPDAGVFIVDTGIDSARAAGEGGPAVGAVRSFTQDIEPVQPLAAILEQEAQSLAGVLLTHLHIDHILGLPDVPQGTPIYVGPDEQASRKAVHAVTRRSYQRAFQGRTFSVWPTEDAHRIEGLAVFDVVGDGSIWAIHTPGHSSGSMSFLANTTQGPALFVGDTSHTRWGWVHTVTPGSYTEDHDRNAQSLQEMKRLAQAADAITVYVGHELDGEGTGVRAGQAGVTAARR